MSFGSDYLRDAMILNERNTNNKKSLKESIEDKQQPLKEGVFTDDLYSDIQVELQYSIKDSLDNILANLIDNITRDYPDYNPGWAAGDYLINTEQYSEEMSEIIMKDLFANM